MQFKTCGLIAILIVISLLGYSTVQAKWLVGSGMDYFTVKTVVIDKENRFFHSVLQSTLMKSSVAFENDYMHIGLSGGWSDWNASGEWQGTNVERISYDPFGWVGQQMIEAEVEIIFLNSFVLAVAIAEHRVRHYDSQTDFSYLSYKKQTFQIGVDYIFYKDSSLRMKAGAAYAPKVAIHIEQDTMIPESEFAVHQHEEDGEGHSWQGQFQFDYQDSAGWGLRVDYYYNHSIYSKFQTINSYTISSGSIKGLFYVYF